MNTEDRTVRTEESGSSDIEPKRGSTIELQDNIESSGKQNTEASDNDSQIVEKLDDAIDEMGGFGKHQKQMWLLFTFAFAMGSYAVYPMGYYEL